MSYGVLLPHFGPHADAKLLLRSVPRMEQLGFDAIWVRDHIVFHPHGFEDPDLTHMEPFIVMSALAAVTKKIILGTATLIPYRHPIHTALLLGSLDAFAGPDRLIVGFGLGFIDSEFDAVGMKGWDRREVLPQQVEAIRKLCAGQHVSLATEYYNFSDVAIQPVPGPNKKIPIWYGGGTKASVRRAVEYCDGWIPGRMPARDAKLLIDRMQMLSEKAGRSRPLAAIIPYVSPAKTVEEGAKVFNMEELHSVLATRFMLPPSGRFETLDDFDGAVIAGPPEVIVEKVRAFQSVGFEHFVFDFRTQFERFEECIEVVGGEVLPLLHRGDGRG
jgi:alkanesulfonate monooxygenase SsuD/methylene tetrahydromethanopterin reductase-like flavin-dependent oxidoreductase (luciferase family)